MSKFWNVSFYVALALLLVTIVKSQDSSTNSKDDESDTESSGHKTEKSLNNDTEEASESDRPEEEQTNAKRTKATKALDVTEATEAKDGTETTPVFRNLATGSPTKDNKETGEKPAAQEETKAAGKEEKPAAQEETKAEGKEERPTAQEEAKAEGKKEQPAAQEQAKSFRQSKEANKEAGKEDILIILEAPPNISRREQVRQGITPTPGPSSTLIEGKAGSTPATTPAAEVEDTKAEGDDTEVAAEVEDTKVKHSGVAEGDDTKAAAEVDDTKAEGDDTKAEAEDTKAEGDNTEVAAEVEDTKVNPSLSIDGAAEGDDTEVAAEVEDTKAEADDTKERPEDIVNKIIGAFEEVSARCSEEKSDEEGGQTYVASTEEVTESSEKKEPSCGLSMADAKKVLKFIKPNGVYVQGILTVLADNGWADEVKDIRRARIRAAKEGSRLIDSELGGRDGRLRPRGRRGRKGLKRRRQGSSEEKNSRSSSSKSK